MTQPESGGDGREEVEGWVGGARTYDCQWASMMAQQSPGYLRNELLIMGCSDDDLLMPWEIDWEDEIVD